MKRIVVASQNPVKLRATYAGFTRMFPDERFSVEGISVPSDVADQPMTDADTLQGALNRAKNAASAVPHADYWVGIEGGVGLDGDEMQVFAWIVVLAHGLTGKAKTGTFYLPQEVVRLVRQGRELGDADDLVFGRSNSKQQNGSIGILTGDVIDRADYYEPAVIMALVPFKNPHLSWT
jgi:inosine/xanthosine triphosphatase